MDHKEYAKVFKAFCDENRIMILEILQDGSHCACELLDSLEIGQSTLSHHMKILCDSGLVNGRKEGKWMHYSINLQGKERAKEILAEITELKSIDKVFEEKNK